MDPQEILDLVLFQDLSRWPCRPKGPIRGRGQHNVAILLSGRNDAQVTLGRGRFGNGSQFGDSLCINNQLLSSRLVGHPCAAKLHGVVVPVVNDVEFTPEDTVDSGPIFHTGHIEFVGTHEGIQGDMLTWGQLEVKGCRHLENRRGAIGRSLLALVSFEV